MDIQPRYKCAKCRSVYDTEDEAADCWRDRISFHIDVEQIFYCPICGYENSSENEAIDCCGYTEQSNAVRNGIITKWRSWAFEHEAQGEEQRLRGVIGAAYLRLQRLDDSNPEVCHARRLLECAMNGNRAEWP